MQTEIYPGKLLNEERSVEGYRLIIVPDDGMRAALAEEAAYAAACYGLEVQWSEKPVLELLHFYARAEMEDTLLRWMQRICGQSVAFDLVFNNYGSRPDMPLYLRVTNGTALQSLAASFHLLDGWLKSNGMAAVRPSPTPWLPLVKRLVVKDARAFLLDFSSRLMYAVLRVEELVLEKNDGQIVSRLPLHPVNCKPSIK